MYILSACLLPPCMPAMPLCLWEQALPHIYAPMAPIYTHIFSLLGRRLCCMLCPSPSPPSLKGGIDTYREYLLCIFVWSGWGRRRGRGMLLLLTLGWRFLHTHTHCGGCLCYMPPSPWPLEVREGTPLLSTALLHTSHYCLLCTHAHTHTHHTRQEQLSTCTLWKGHHTTSHREEWPVFITNMAALCLVSHCLPPVPCLT